MDGRRCLSLLQFQTNTMQAVMRMPKQQVAQNLYPINVIQFCKYVFVLVLMPATCLKQVRTGATKT